MDDVTTVTIVDGGEDLLNDVGSVLLAEILLLGDLLEKFSSVAEFCYQEVPLCVLEELVELKNIRVVHLFEDADFSKEFLFLILLEVLFVDDLDGAKCIRLLGETLANLAVRTSSNARRNLVVGLDVAFVHVYKVVAADY